MGKDSFILYDKYDEQIEFLTNEQAGILFKSIYAHRNGKPLPDMDGVVKMAFSFICSQLDQDQERYDDICEKRRAAGAMGGAPKGNQNAGKQAKQAKQANGFKNKQNKQKQAKQPDNDNEYDNEYDNESDINIIKEKKDNKLSKKKEFTPPTIEQVEAYAKERGREDLAKQFFDYFNAGDWVDSNGAPVRSWKQKFITWETHTPKKEEAPPPTEKRRFFMWDGD